MKQPPKKPATKPTARATPKVPAKAQKQNLAPEPLEEEIPTTPPEEELDLEEEMPVASAPPPEEAPPAGLTIGGEPIDPVKTLGFIESIIGTLTFRTVALVALLTTIGLLIFALYENRTSIVDRFTAPQATTSPIAAVPIGWVLSEGSKQSLMTLAATTGVRVVLLSDVDLKKNRRIVRYYYLDDQGVVLPPAALQALALPLPVFDYDAKNTEQMIAVLSNDFRCDPFVDTIYNRFAPSLAERYPTICRMAVPPFVGTFVGFITVALGPEVTPSERESIRLEVSRIAVEIYMNDVAKKVSPVTPGK